MLEHHADRAVTRFAYPFGLHDDPCARRRRPTHFDVAFTTRLAEVRPGDDPLAMPANRRLTIWARGCCAGRLALGLPQALPASAPRPAPRARQRTLRIMAAMSILSRATRHGRLSLRAASVTERGTPPFLILFINSICNLKCEHCFYWQSLNSRDDLSFDELVALSEDLGPIENLNLSGGEPFLRKEFADDLPAIHRRTTASRRSTCRPTATTPNAPSARSRRSSEDDRLDLFACELSLDGMPEFHNEFRGNKRSFEKAMETYDSLVELQNAGSRACQIHAISTVTDTNVDEIRRLTTFLFERCPEMEHHNLALIRGDRKDPSLQGPALDAFRELDRYAKRLWAEREESRLGAIVDPMLTWAKVRTAAERRQVVPCQAGVLSGVVYANGDVALCETTASHPPVGNLAPGELPRDLEFSGGRRAAAQDPRPRVPLHQRDVLVAERHLPAGAAGAGGGGRQGLAPARAVAGGRAGGERARRRSPAGGRGLVIATTARAPFLRLLRDVAVLSGGELGAKDRRLPGLRPARPHPRPGGLRRRRAGGGAGHGLQPGDRLRPRADRRPCRRPRAGRRAGAGASRRRPPRAVGRRRRRRDAGLAIQVLDLVAGRPARRHALRPVAAGPAAPAQLAAPGTRPHGGGGAGVDAAHGRLPARRRVAGRRAPKIWRRSAAVEVAAMASMALYYVAVVRRPLAEASKRCAETSCAETASNGRAGGLSRAEVMLRQAAPVAASQLVWALNHYLPILIVAHARRRGRRWPSSAARIAS